MLPTPVVESLTACPVDSVNFDATYSPYSPFQKNETLNIDIIVY